MKLVVVLLAVLALVWLIGGRRRAARRDPPRRAGAAVPPGPEAMLECARCGVHVPRSEASWNGSQAYCCPQHRDAGPLETRR
jgi:uncharacterized protein